MALTESEYSVAGIFRLLFGNRVRRGLVQGSAGTFLIKVSYALLSLLIGVALSRLLGVDAYGAFAWIAAWVAVLGVPCEMGLGRLLVRYLAAYHAHGSYAPMKGLLRRSKQAVVVVSVGAATAAYVAGRLLLGPSRTLVRDSFVLALPVIPLMALTRLTEGASKGLNRVLRAQIPEYFLRPLLFIGLVGAVWIASIPMTIRNALVLNDLSYAAAAMLGFWLLRRATPHRVETAEPVYEMKAWWLSALPLMLVNGMQVLRAQIDIIVVGAVVGSSAAGVYSAATKGAALVSFVLSAVAAPISPLFAELHARQELDRIGRIGRVASVVILLLSIPVALALILLGKTFLSMFGPEFVSGVSALRILSVAQLVNAGAGTVGVLLVMTGHENETARGVGLGTVANLVLNLALVPTYGIMGAAVATGVSIVIWNVYLVWRVRVVLGIRPTAVGFSRRE